jgi:hypothetical protein
MCVNLSEEPASILVISVRAIWEQQSERCGMYIGKRGSCLISEQAQRGISRREIETDCDHRREREGGVERVGADLLDGRFPQGQSIIEIAFRLNFYPTVVPVPAERIYALLTASWGRPELDRVLLPRPMTAVVTPQYGAHADSLPSPKAAACAALTMRRNRERVTDTMAHAKLR